MYEDILAGVTSDLITDGRKNLTKYLRKIIALVRDGRKQIVIVGPGGVGKSTFGKMLETGVSPPVADYQESITLETFSFGADFFGTAFVVPGQETSGRILEWQAAQKAIAGGRVSGVVNVVCYGLHTPRTETMKSHSLYRSGDTVDQFLKRYTKNRRELEIDQFSRLIAPHMQACTKPIWLLTAVLKQDLWWNTREEVKKHYENGPYQEMIEELTKAKIISHTINSASLTAENLTFSGEIGRPIKSTAAGYDDAIRLRNQSSLFSNLERLLSK